MSAARATDARDVGRAFAFFRPAWRRGISAFAVVGVSSLVLSCAEDSGAGDATADHRAVCRAVLDHVARTIFVEYDVSADRVSGYVLSPEPAWWTIGGPRWSDFRLDEWSWPPSTSRDVMDAFVRVQQVHEPGPPWADAPAPFEIVDDEALAVMAGDPSSDPWVGYASHGVGQLVDVSLAAFDSTRNEALVYYELSHQPGCGHGMVARLVRESSGWRVTGTMKVWIT